MQIIQVMGSGPSRYIEMVCPVGLSTSKASHTVLLQWNLEMTQHDKKRHGHKLVTRRSQGNFPVTEFQHYRYQFSTITGKAREAQKDTSIETVLLTDGPSLKK